MGRGSGRLSWSRRRAVWFSFHLLIHVRISPLRAPGSIQQDPFSVFTITARSWAISELEPSWRHFATGRADGRIVAGAFRAAQGDELSTLRAC